LPWLLLAGLVAMLGLWRARRAAVAGDELAGLTLAGVVGVLISPVSWVHHIIWVFPAMLILTMRLVSSIRALADDNSGYASSDRALMVRIAQVIGYSVLMTAGLAIWCIPTASLMNVRDGDYDHAGALLAFAGSVQLIWLVIALVVLPIERRSNRGPSPAPADAAAQQRRPDAGTVPASALRSKVILPPSALDEPARSTGEQRPALPTQREQ
jgi:alpha-1,2-mannosyltransferase